MQFVVTKQIAVEADTAEEAVSKSSEGNTISINVNIRPQHPQPPPTSPVQTGTRITP